jgi:hypothetical protein
MIFEAVDKKLGPLENLVRSIPPGTAIPVLSLKSHTRTPAMAARHLYDGRPVIVERSGETGWTGYSADNVVVTALDLTHSVPLIDIETLSNRKPADTNEQLYYCIIWPWDNTPSNSYDLTSFYCTDG